MRIALFDDILERHVRRSLARGLRRRGHEVVESPPVWHGHKFPSNEADILRIYGAVEEIVGLHPDILLNFRAATLSVDMVRFLRQKGIRTAVWLPDDPVLYRICYSSIVEHYDIVLNCGGARVLEWYESRHGIRGVNFPFWTDDVEFPRRSAPPTEATFDVAFLGNLRGAVRSWRYDILAGLPGTVRVYGQADHDPKGLVQGYLETEAEVAETLGRARLGFSIPQVFSDYRSHEYDFEGLAGLGSFEYPSRVVQYAAVGLPIVSYGLARPPASFPEMIVASDPAAAAIAVQQALDDTNRLDRIADATARRFDLSFSAQVRAEFLEALAISPESILSAPSQLRACLFADRAFLQ